MPAYTMLAKTLADKLANLETDALKVMLLTAYTPGQDTHQFVSDVLAAGTEAAGAGYSAGGKALTSVTLTKSGHVYTLDCADVSWPSSTLTNVKYAVFYDSTPGSNATNPVIAFWDFSATPQSSSNGTFTLTINANGVVQFTGS